MTAEPDAASTASTASTATPTLRAVGARIEIGGATAIAHLDLETRGERVLLVGASAPLVAAISGAPLDGEGGDVAKVARGRLELGGADVASGAHHAVCGVAPRGAPLPPRWKVSEYLSWCARLSEVPRRQAPARVAATLEVLGLAEWSGRRLRTLSAPERQALSVAAAVTHDPRVVVVESPLELLDDEGGWSVLGVLARACEGRAAVVSLPQLLGLSGPAAQLARTASDICLLRDGELLLHAEPREAFADAPLYQLTVADGAAALQEALLDRGLPLDGGPRHFALRLVGGATVNDVLATAAEVRAAIVSCLPLM